jgi:hypothetical protein
MTDQLLNCFVMIETLLLIEIWEEFKKAKGGKTEQIFKREENCL